VPSHCFPSFLLTHSLGADQYRVVNASSGIIHPAQMMGPAEVALMQYRVQQGLPPTMMAFNTLLNGSLASRKMYRNATGVWWPPTGEGAAGTDAVAVLCPHPVGP
jgi:hypothetical protein